MGSPELASLGLKKAAILQQCHKQWYQMTWAHYNNSLSRSVIPPLCSLYYAKITVLKIIVTISEDFFLYTSFHETLYLRISLSETHSEYRSTHSSTRL